MMVYMKPRELAGLAVEILEKPLGELSEFDQAEVLAIAQGLVNIKIHRLSNPRPARRKEPDDGR